jgi:cystathionine beta-lyase
MNSEFDRRIERRGTGSVKWQTYGDDVLPLWVADMDFRCPEAVLETLNEQISHGIFGYSDEPPEIREIIVDRLFSRYQWRVSPDWLVFFPGVVNNLNLIYRTLSKSNDDILVQTPAYPPFLENPGPAGLNVLEVELAQTSQGNFEIDFDGIDDINTANSRLFILCNPHNPVGRVYTKAELERIAQFCLKNDLIICSDDIHCEIVYSGNRYLPIASLDQDISDRTITMLSPGKTFNIADLKFSVAVISDESIRKKLISSRTELDIGPNKLGYMAALTAYSGCDAWHRELLAYLEENRQIVQELVRTELPGIEMASPEGTFLAWLDCRKSGIPGNPQHFFLKQAKVALNDGDAFGKGGKGFVRLNFGCPKHLLRKALNRMKTALARI